MPASGAWADQHPARHVGASVDVSRRLPLPSADLCGYLIAIVLLRLIVGPILTDIPVIGVIHARGSHGNGWHAPRT